MLLCRNRLKTVMEYRTSDGSKYLLCSSSWDLQTGIPHNGNILWHEQGASGVEYMFKRIRVLQMGLSEIIIIQIEH